MTSIHYSSCFDPAILHPEWETQHHFENCNATNLYEHGLRRWYFSTVRCECKCHELERSDEEIFLMDIKQNLLMLAHIALIIILLITAIAIGMTAS